MRNINQQYQIDYDSNAMWIPNNHWEEREDGREHYLPGLSPLDVDKDMAQQAKSIGIHMIRKVELKNLSARLLKRAFLIKAYHLGDGATLQTDVLPVEFQQMLAEFLGLFCEPTCANSQNGWQANFEIKPDPNGKIPFHSPYRFSPWEEAQLRTQIAKVISCNWIQPSRSNLGSQVLFVEKPERMLPMCILYCAVNPITVNNHYPLPHIDDSLNSIHGSYRFTKLDLAAGYHQIRIATANRQETAFPTKFGLYEWRVLLFGLANTPSQLMHMMNSMLESTKRKFIVIYLDNSMIHSRTLAELVIHVREVLASLTEHGLKAKRAQCAWACQKVDFCSIGIDKDGIHALEHTTCTVTDWPQPENFYGGQRLPGPH